MTVSVDPMIIKIVFLITILKVHWDVRTERKKRSSAGLFLALLVDTAAWKRFESEIKENKTNIYLYRIVYHAVMNEAIFNTIFRV